MRARWLRHAVSLPVVGFGAWYGVEHGSSGAFSPRGRGSARLARLARGVEVPRPASTAPYRGSESPSAARGEPCGAGGQVGRRHAPRWRGLSGLPKLEVLAGKKERGAEHQRSADPVDEPEGPRPEPRRNDRRE